MAQIIRFGDLRTKVALEKVSLGIGGSTVLEGLAGGIGKSEWGGQVERGEQLY